MDDKDYVDFTVVVVGGGQSESHVIVALIGARGSVFDGELAGQPEERAARLGSRVGESVARQQRDGNGRHCDEAR